MRIRYQQLKAHPNVLHSLSGLRPKEFEQLVADVRPLFSASEQQRLLLKRPHKERPPTDVAYNRAFAQRMLVVEHTLRRMRQYQALSQIDRHHRKMHTERVAAVAGLVNRKMQYRLPYLFI